MTAGLVGSAVLLTIQALVCVPAVRTRLGHAEIYDSVLQDMVDLLAGIVILMRAALVRRERAAWVLVGCGVLLFAAGDVYWTAVVQPLDPRPDISFADVLWLSLYPCLWVGLCLLLRARLPRMGFATLLDGLIVAVSVAAFASLPFLAALEGTNGGNGWETITTLAYPTADIVLAGCLFGAWALSGWRTERVWLLLLAGMAAFTVGDALSTLELLGRDYAAGPWLDLTWSAGLVATAMAGWQRTGVRPNRRTRIVVTAAPPALLACACLGLLLYGNIHDQTLHLTTSMLAAAAVAAAVLRMLLTLRTVEALSDARRQARTDDLTELPNRRWFLEHLGVELVDRDAGSPLAVALIDLDRFKEVNDSFGHHVGDRLLQLVARRLLDAVGNLGTLSRIGGDEFGLILPAADVDSARAMAAKLLTALRDPFELDEAALHVDASIGLAVFPQDGTEEAALLRHADTAMHTAKTSHSGFSLRANNVDDHSTRLRLNTLEELRAGLDHGDLVLHYQPQIDIATRAVLGVEALVRWDHPNRGLLYPDAFLPIAERAGLMDRITTVVLDLALAQCARWRDEGLALTVAVNLSSSNLQDLNFPGRVASALRRHSVPAASLHLEVTEGALMADATQAYELLSALSQLGIRLAVDDYGMGYSSLSYLHGLPIDDLKLDRTFVAHCDTDQRSAAIVESTVDLAHNLGMRMIAEGVENDAVLSRLKDFGCDMGQGYFLARPQNPLALTPWLHQQAALLMPAKVVSAIFELPLPVIR